MLYVREVRTVSRRLLSSKGYKKEVYEAHTIYTALSESNKQCIKQCSKEIVTFLTLPPSYSAKPSLRFAPSFLPCSFPNRLVQVTPLLDCNNIIVGHDFGSTNHGTLH